MNELKILEKARNPSEFARRQPDTIGAWRREMSLALCGTDMRMV
jgi:hypothetical protein